MAAIETITVEPDEAGMRVDRWFKTHYPELSFGHLQKLLRSGQIRVDGGRVKTNARLEPGQAVRVPPLGAGDPPPQSGAGRPREARGRGRDGREDKPPSSPIRGDNSPAVRGKTGGVDAAALRAMTLHEDDDVLVLNKPAGLAVQGGSGLTKHVDAMLEALRDRKGQKPRLVHRLDRDTSGVLVVAKTRLAAQRLAASFRSRSTRKIYWALVMGVPKPKQGRISTWLARDEGEERMKIARHGTDDSSHAVSLYSVVETAGQKLAWLSMRPVTGRTHQLRAHAAHIGHPIIGDPKYFEAEESWDFPGGIQKKLHLHARRIVIPHPNGGKPLDVTAPLPPHMQQSWNLLGFDASLGDAQQDEDD
ncbi:MAG TPA: RluA family pseudouridine synthase [Bauldia sp.]|nr:RluA family pseudouridine synthase [Bauldia sp.]